MVQSKADRRKEQNREAQTRYRRKLKKQKEEQERRNRDQAECPHPSLPDQIAPESSTRLSLASTHCQPWDVQQCLDPRMTVHPTIQTTPMPSEAERVALDMVWLPSDLDYLDRQNRYKVDHQRRMNISRAHWQQAQQRLKQLDIDKQRIDLKLARMHQTETGDNDDVV